MRYSDFYGYRGRVFASYAAAESARRIGKWFKNQQSSKNPSKLTQKLFQAIPNSFTKTKTKTEQEDQSTTMSTNPTSKNFIKVFSGLPALKRVVGNKIQYRDEFGYEIPWKSNEQKYIELFSFGTRQMWLGTAANTDKNRSNGLYGSPYDMNPNQMNTGGVLSTEILTSDWMGISDATVYMDFLNLTNLSCFVKLHWFKAKTADELGPLWSYKESAVGNQVYNQTWAFPSDGLVPIINGSEHMNWADGNSNFPVQAVTLPYTNLMSRTDLKSGWKKLKTTSFGLAPNDSHRLTVSHILNMFQSKQRVNNDLMFPKHTIQCVVEFQGAASHYKKASGDNQYDSPTLAGGNVAVTVTRKMNLKTLKASNERYDLSYVGRGTVVQGAPITEAIFMGNDEVMTQIGALVT